MAVVIKEVTDSDSLQSFVFFNIKLYKGHPYHVPELVTNGLMNLRKDKNPAFEFCESVYYLAYKNDQVAGRIAGIINYHANKKLGQQYARFGFVDFIDDDQVSNALFKAVEKWARDKGMNGIQGPLGFTDLDHRGLLVRGFDQLGTMATTYNCSYYKEHLTRLGYKKDQDWEEFHIQISNSPDKHRQIDKIVMQKYGFRIVKFKQRKQLLSYVKKIFQLWNEICRSVYGYLELSDRLIEYYSKMYMPIFLRLKEITLIFHKVNVIGMGITIPRLSKALQMAKGRLFPLGWIHLLKALYSEGKVVDLYIMGMHPRYKKKGLNILFSYDLVPIRNKMGFFCVKSNPALELNSKMHLKWNYFDIKHLRKYRIFVKYL
jgi:hypothetical protein